VIAARLLLILAALLEPAQGLLSDAGLLERAESTFRRGKASHSQPTQAQAEFALAAAAYKEIYDRGYRSAALFANQGNAYFLAGDLPNAILAYRRGLQIDPGDRSLRARLELARGQVDYPRAGTGDSFRWVPRLSPRVLWTCLVCLYGLACVSGTRWWMIRRGWQLKAMVCAAIGALVCAAGIAWAELDRREDVAHPIVVVARDQVSLRKGNGHRYPPADDKPLNRGVEAHSLRMRGGWLQIELADGKVGWIPGADALTERW
jgi:tetratricopeptide (TPR) repeat protein